MAPLVHFERHRLEQTTVYRLVQQHAATFFAQAEDAAGADLPRFVKDEFGAFLKCGILANGFLRLRCGDCGHDKLVAFSRKRRGFCPSCGARRMAQTAAHRVGHVIPHVPLRQWVLSLPIPLRRGAVTLVQRFGSAAIATSTCMVWCWTACSGESLKGRRNWSRYPSRPTKRCSRCCTRSSPAR